MSRKEEIQEAAEKAYPYKGGAKGYIFEASIPIFIKGAEWADSTMIEKACKWIGNHLINVGIEGVIEEFKKAMEE